MALSHEQLRFWNLFYETTIQGNFIYNYTKRTEFIDRGLKIILALTSSSSIGAWVIWKDHSMIWASFIALSQVITAINPLLPYTKRLSSLHFLGSEIQHVILEIEDEWQKVSNSHYKNSEIHELTIKFKKRLTEIQNKHFKNATLPNSKCLQGQAEEDAKTHFDKNYPAEE